MPKGPAYIYTWHGVMIPLLLVLLAARQSEGTTGAVSAEADHPLRGTDDRLHVNRCPLSSLLPH